MIKTFKSSVFLCAMSALFLCGACHKEQSPIPEVLGEYLKYHAEKGKTVDGYDAYFDLSDGMLAAYSNDTTKAEIKSIINKITGNKNCRNIYSLKEGTVSKLDKSQTELYNYILNPSSYATVAPIEETLKKITSHGTSAFLVTDFEEYSNGVIQQQNYAKAYFVDWLKKGGDITFFITNYLENGKQKHLYFTVFDMGGHSLLKDIENALEGSNTKYTRFNLTANVVGIEYGYSGTKGGCYHDLDGEDIVSVTNESGEGDCFTLYKDYHAEYYPFNETWANIVKNAKDLSEEGNTPRFTHLITGPKANLTSLSGYNVKELDLKVTNIQDDFAKFAGYYEYTKDKTMNVDENGKLLDEYNYLNKNNAANMPEIEDMLKYAGSVKNGVATLNVDFDEDFNGTSSKVNPLDLLRVDIVIDECEPKYDLVTKLFSWQGNNSLEQAVRNTLQEVNPEGQVIYTFFMRDGGE